jgi:hypothetical protein
MESTFCIDKALGSEIRQIVFCWLGKLGCQFFKFYLQVSVHCVKQNKRTEETHLHLRHWANTGLQQWHWRRGYLAGLGSVFEDVRKSISLVVEVGTDELGVGSPANVVKASCGEGVKYLIRVAVGFM